jgi:large conductance mechanosensitive channel
MFKGFRDFILRGNVVDLAVAVIIGAAFNAIVASLVSDLLNPLLAATVGKPNFSYLVLHVNNGEVKYGNFLNAAISFLIVASAVYFGVVMPINLFLRKVNKPAPAPAPATKPCTECLSEIPLLAKRCAFCGQPVAATAV